MKGNPESKNVGWEGGLLSPESKKRGGSKGKRLKYIPLFRRYFTWKKEGTLPYLPYRFCFLRHLIQNLFFITAFFAKSHEATSLFISTYQ